ncbi:hypothetical protein VOLCADRAFT_108615 [Volvox carteri f. nagariensis]|uniref:Tryptophan synthase beta chain-like PALP domain-containing protein n=1 Tax=Volvox carteri f. nagariensis TaxID=3068 RepID=D8UL90_VOLCA|nr:uncharacterized protein VOLCADRAFT_108615 [Volvox carteri f. nagariensis]EFJ39510.1 hypothetical protein VOLCADRAFT_108615 [Volvox carteri f. nagariensis]|eukprot:XP_002959425.1 hypothetical protein VOLCADRAFT_108615 [Volvox carteri f. nagariensis]
MVGLEMKPTQHLYLRHHAVQPGHCHRTMDRTEDFPPLPTMYCPCRLAESDLRCVRKISGRAPKAATAAETSTQTQESRIRDTICKLFKLDPSRPRPPTSADPCPWVVVCSCAVTTETAPRWRAPSVGQIAKMEGLLAGELSPVNRVGFNLPDDVFRCFGCTQPACQGPEGCAANKWRFGPDGYLREILTARVYDVAIQSPLEKAQKLSEAVGNTVLLKREDLQPVFSFKLRGAYNKMAKLPPEARARGVITSSAGNHAQGVALAASKMGCTSIICMPVNTPEIKVANVRKLGGQVVLVGESYQEAQAAAVARAAAEGLTFIPPYDDPYTIAGQGTIGDEIMQQTHRQAHTAEEYVAKNPDGLLHRIAKVGDCVLPDESDDEGSVGSEIAEAYYPSDNEEVENVASDEVYPSEETDDDVAGCCLLCFVLSGKPVMM